MITTPSFLMPSFRSGTCGHRTVFGEALPSPPLNGCQGKDQVTLKHSSASVNPFEGVAPGFSKVSVEPWGEGRNGSLTQILRNQGYSDKEMNTPDANGVTLLQRVAAANGLRNPNLIHPRQTLQVPSRQPAQGPMSHPSCPQSPGSVPTLEDADVLSPEGQPPSFLRDLGESVDTAGALEDTNERLDKARGRTPAPRSGLLKVLDPILTVVDTALEINDIRQDDGDWKAERTVEAIGKGVGEFFGGLVGGTMLAGAASGLVAGLVAAGPIGWLVGGGLILGGALLGGALGKWLGGMAGQKAGEELAQTPLGRGLGERVLESYDRVLGPWETLMETARAQDAGNPRQGSTCQEPVWSRMAWT